MDVTRDLEIISIQERKLQLPQFDAAVAWQLGLRLRELGLSRQARIVIDVRRFGEQLFYAALPGTSPDNFEWVRKKSNVVARFYRSSYAIGLNFQQQGQTPFEAHGLSPEHYMCHGGSFPVAVAGVGVIGSITVSGLPQRADHELVVEALSEHIGVEYAALALPATTKG